MNLGGVGRRRDERGAEAVEFALIMPLLLLLVFGIIQYGLYFWAFQGGEAAAREAARRGAVGKPTSCLTFRSGVMTNISSMSQGNVVIKRTFDAAPVTAGQNVTVTVAFDSADLNLPFIPFVDNGRITQTATSRVDFVPDSSIGDCT